MPASIIAFASNITYAQRSISDCIRVLYPYMIGMLQHGDMIVTFCTGSLYLVHGEKQTNELEVLYENI